MGGSWSVPSAAAAGWLLMKHAFHKNSPAIPFGQMTRKHRPQPRWGCGFLPTISQGSSCLATLICFPDMISWPWFMLKLALNLPRQGGYLSLGDSTEASEASRSGIAQRQVAGKTAGPEVQAPSHFCPHVVAGIHWASYFSCASRNMRPTPLCKRWSAACASSCNPRTTLVSPKPSQSRARPVLQTRTVAGAAATTASSYK